MSLFQFETTVFDDGTLADPLPEAFWGGKIVVGKQPAETGTLIDNDFYRFKPLREILDEQGAKPVAALEELMPDGPAWDSQEEFFSFLEAIGEDVDNTK